MLPMNKNALILSLLAASLSLSACGSKKDVIAGQPVKKEQTTKTGGQLGKELPNPLDEEENTLPQPLPENVSKPQPPTKTPPPPPPPAPINGGNSNVGGNTQTPVVTPVAPAPQIGTNPIPGDYRANDPANVTRDNLTKRMTGGMTADGLVYTSSSTDDLLTFLRLRNERVSYETRQANLAAAASVVSAKLNIDEFSGDAIVTVKVQEGSDVKVYNLAGMNNLGGGTASNLRSVRAGNGETSTGTRPIDGTLKCMDLDGGCDTTFVRLRLGYTGSSSIVNLVFRNSAADLFVKFPDVRSENAEYLFLQEFVTNTIRQIQIPNRIKTVRMNSWEVVNGRSGVMVSVKGFNNELLGFASPLLAPEAGTGVNINASRLAKDKDDSLDLLDWDRAQLNYANSIGEARLVANNGLGQVRLLLKMRKRGNFPQEQFTMTFMRKIKPLVDLTDDNLK